MVPLLPYQKLIFESPLSREELFRKLSREVSNRRRGWPDKRTELFEGTISEEGFQINQIIRYRNSFLPIIHGRFFPSVQGVRVEVVMRLHVVVLIFSIVWLSFVGLFAAVVVSRLLATGRVETVTLFPFGMLLFYYLMVTIGFGTEAKKASELLSGLFETESLSA